MCTLHIQTSSQWDALALARRLSRYHWYLLEPGPERWDVCVPIDAAADKLPAQLRAVIELWLNERGLDATTISAGDRSYSFSGGET
jgi:hypothetical protein